MPPAAPIIAGAALAGASAALSGATIVGVALAVGGTLALGALRLALAPKSSFGSQDRTSVLRQPITDRRFPVGEVVQSGPLTYYDATEDNENHLMIITLGDAPEAPWDGIPLIWVDGTPVFEEEIDADGWVISGRFSDVSDRLRIGKNLGGPDQTADQVALDFSSRLDTNFKGTGVAYLTIRLNWSPSRFPNGLPNIKAHCRTNTVMDVRDSTRRYTNNAALCLREYMISHLGYEAADFDDTQTAAAANVCDEIVDARAVGHAVESVDTADDALRLCVRESGAPLRLETGDRVEIFTDGTAPGGLATGTSYYVIVEKLVGHPIKKKHRGEIALDPTSYSGAAATAIGNDDVDTVYNTAVADDWVEVFQAEIKLATSYANALDRTAIDITSTGSGQHLVIKTGEPRYTVSGMAESGEAPKDAIDNMLSAMAGRLVWTGGVFRVHPAAWSTPITPTFDEGDLWGALTVQTKHSRRDRFNAVRGVFATLLTQGEPTDYPSVIDTTYVANDNGVEIYRDIDRPFTSRAATAQRLGKIDLARHRREIRVEYPTGPQGLLAVPGSVVQINNTRRGWTNKTFEVLEQEDFLLEPEGGDSPPLQGVKLHLAELDSTAFDFVAASDETVKAPAATPPEGSPFEIAPPEDLTLVSGNEALFLKADGTVVSRIRVTWTTVDAFGLNDEVQVKKTADTTWQKLGLIPAGDGEIYVWDVDDGVSYDVRVRSISELGVRSEWVQAPPHQVEGKTEPPPDVDTFTVARMADGTRRFSWTATKPADVRAGGGFQIRYVSGTGGTWSGMTDLHDGLLQNTPYETNELGAGTYTFGIKMVDSSGNESTNARLIEATLGDPRLRDVLVSRNEKQLAWPGTLTDCFVTPENTLEAVSNGSWGAGPTWDGVATTWDTLETTWDALDTGGSGNELPATWDALADTWREILPSKSPITYETPVIDLGADVRMTPIVNAEGIGTITSEMKVGTESNGGVTGGYEALSSASARYVQLRITVTGSTPVLSSLVIYLDGETQVEDYEDVDTSGLTFGRFERIATGDFKLATRGDTASITSATIRAFQSAGSGWTWELVSKATTITGDSEPAAHFRIYKNGTLADAVIDAEIKGPKT